MLNAKENGRQIPHKLTRYGPGKSERKEKKYIQKAHNDHDMEMDVVLSESGKLYLCQAWKFRRALRWISTLTCILPFEKFYSSNREIQDILCLY